MNKKNRLKECCNIFLENRYKFSGVMFVILTIIGFFINQINIKEWILTTNKVLSPWLNFKFFAILLASYELFFIITNKNKKMSVAGTIVLAFSGYTFWNYTKYDALILAEIITILIYGIITSNNIRNNILRLVAIVGCSIGYMYTFRPFAIAFGYVFFALILWILLENRKEIKGNKKNIIILTAILSITSAIITAMFLKNCYSEDVENFIIGFSGIFTYLYNTLLPFFELENVGFFGGIMSIAPIPMCLALYYIYKNEKHENFLLPMVIVTVLETIYCISGFPQFINKFTLLATVSSIRVIPAVQLANLFILFYFLGNIDDFSLNIKHSIRITIFTICILAFLKYPIVFTSKKFLYLYVAELCMMIFMFLNYSNKKYQKVFIGLLVILSLISSLPVFWKIL